VAVHVRQRTGFSPGSPMAVLAELDAAAFAAAAR